jgi:hypothetical protein
MLATSSFSADPPKPPDEVVDFGSLTNWASSGCNAEIYKGLLVATLVYERDAKDKSWKPILNWTLAAHTGVMIKQGRRKDRAYVISLADAFIVKRLAQHHAALTSALVTDPKFKAGFARFVAMYRISDLLEQGAGLTVVFATLRENVVAQSAAAKKLDVAASWTHARECARVVAGFAAWKQVATDAKAMDNGLKTLRTPTAVRSLATETMSSPHYFPISATAFAGAGNACMTMPAAADFDNGVDKACLRSLDTFGPGILHVATPVNEKGWCNRNGEAASPTLIGMPMSISIERYVVPNGRDRWADTDTPFIRRRAILRAEKQCPSLILTSL